MLTERKLQFWNSRAAVGRDAGSNDFILKQLELEQILRRVPRSATVLDVGCGNGDTLIHLATHNDCAGTGIDFSPAMIRAAVAAAKQADCEDRVEFREACLPHLPHDLDGFDCAVSERCLINLADADSQHAAFVNIMRCLKPGGCYLMVESFIQGLQKSNHLRRRVDLEPIDPPWHNCFLDEQVVSSWSDEHHILEETIPFTSTYHFLSRVVYARLAADSGEQLRYDSEINKLALTLPSIGDLGPVRMFVWRKSHA